MLHVLLFLVLLLVNAPAFGATRFAAPTDQGAGNCTSTGNACDLQQAMGAAQAGDTVQLACGNYTQAQYNTTRHGTANARITMESVTPWCATLTVPDNHPIGQSAILRNDHSFWTFRYLTLDGKKRARTLFEHNRGVGATTGVIFEWNRAYNADSSCVGGAKEGGDVVRQFVIRFNYIDGCGWGANGEAYYIGSVDAPRAEATVHGNIATRFTHNGPDYKPQKPGQGLVINHHHNIEQEQVYRPNRATKVGLEDGLEMRCDNCKYQNNIMRNFPPVAKPELMAPQVYSISAKRNEQVTNNVAMNLRNMERYANTSRDPGTLGNSSITNNTACNLSGYGVNLVAGVNVNNNTGVPGGAAQSVCDAEVGRILAEQPELFLVDPTAPPLTFVSGTATGTQVNITLQTNGHVLFTDNDTCQAAWACTKAGAAWPDTACAKTGANTIRLTMTGAHAPGQAVSCTYTRGTAGPVFTSAPTEMAAGTYVIVPDDGTPTDSLTLVDAYISSPANVIHMTFNTHGHTLSSDGDTCTTGFSATKAGVAWADTACVKVGDAAIDLTMSGNAAAGETVVLTYTAGTADPVTSSAPAELTAFSQTVRNELGGGGVAAYTQTHCRAEEPGYIQREWMSAEDDVLTVPPGAIIILRCAIAVTNAAAAGVGFRWYAADDANPYYEITNTSVRVAYSQDTSGKRKGGQELLKGLTEDAGLTFVLGGTLLDNTLAGQTVVSIGEDEQAEIAAVLQIDPAATVGQSTTVRVCLADGTAFPSPGGYTVTPTITVGEKWAAN